MKKCMVLTLAMLIVFLLGGLGNPLVSYADEKEIGLSGVTYDLGEKDEYLIDKGKQVSDVAERFIIKGDFEIESSTGGFTSYAVKSGNLKLLVNTEFGKELYEPQSATDWHIITDKTKKVDSTKLKNNIGTGAIIVQTSKDGKTWVNADTEVDIHNKMDAINKRLINGEEIDAFYITTNVQITNGCYYRIIVANKLQREIEPSNIGPIKLKKHEEKERLEVYQFYAYDPSVDKTEKLDIKKAYQLGDVYRVDSPDGFNKNPQLRKGDDPHVDWDVGKFYISGYTDVIMDGDIPVFLMVPGDRAALWFNLEQELDKCNNRTDVKINYIESGSDTYFGTPTINNWGRGALIIRKADKLNQKERQIYTNYLEASATVGANTRVDLFEEGDYEVALDYQLHYDKPFVFGTTTTKTLTYRIFFKFKVRNGDISAFLRDVDTNQFITNANVAENGFYIDVAQSQYLNITIKREVLSESLDGLIEDTKFSGVAKEGRNYTDEGIYTVTVKNLATNDVVVKRIYVGNKEILRAHMKTGRPISEINERVAAGAYIDEEGQIIDPEPETEEVPEDQDEPEEESEESVAESETAIEEQEDIETTGAGEDSNDAGEAETDISEEKAIDSNTEEQADAEVEKSEPKSEPNVFAIVSVLIVVCIAAVVAYKKKSGNKSDAKKEDDK